MIIDVNLLARRGKEKENFCFEFSVKEELVLSSEMVLSNGKVELEISLQDKLQDKIYLSGVISYKVSGPCSRCLEDAEDVVEVQFDETFSQRPQEDEYGYKSGRIDLTQMVEDKILSSQPSILLCDKNCKGLCPKCGGNLNYGGCNCEK